MKKPADYLTNQRNSFASALSDFILQESARGRRGTNPFRGYDGLFVTQMRVVPFALVAMLTLAVGVPSVSALDDHNPIGVTGAFEGVITTGCAYNVLNHNATRGSIDDIVVSGAIGKYGLKMSRYYNSRQTANYLAMGPGWSHEYLWSMGNDKVIYANGNVWDSHCDWGLGGPLGVSDWTTTWNGYPAFRLADGGTVVFESPNFGVATKIIDPYGQITTIALDNSGLITRVTEPGGRYLQFSYYPSSTLLKQVEAYDGVSGHPRLDWVVYHYTPIRPADGGTQGTPMNCLTSVDYSDGQHAYYSYEDDNVPDHPQYGSEKIFPLVSTCNDVRYHGPMSRIAYVYQDQGPHGAVLEERYSPSDGVKGVRVSWIDPPAPSPITETPNFDTAYTETRGDGPSRRFTYTDLHLTRSHGDPEACPITFRGPAPQQFLLTYTDFKNHTTQLHYDVNWYVDTVTDANNHTTAYVRGPPPNAYPGPRGIGEIKKITYQDGTHIDYGYYPESGISGHYLTSITEYNPSNQRRSQTIQYRDDTTHKIYRTDYIDGSNNILAHETFTYCDDADSQCGPPNPTTGQMHGQIKTHRLKNGAYVHYKYDSQGRGLLIDQWEPTWNDSASESDPKTHYEYYASGFWRDRLKTKTLPPNYPYGFQAAETYEYDKNVAGNPTPGRGLVTKITYIDPNDGPYRSFGYDANGNKRWEEDELRNRTSFGYDEYNRLTGITRPLNGITGYTYNSTNGGSRLSHTTSNPDTITVRTSATTNVVTKNDYDENFRKVSSTAAFGTASATTTWFHFDSVGNEDYVTDPRGSDSGDPQYTTYTDYDSRNRKVRVREPLGRTTEVHYDDGFNITRTIRPDNTTETKVFDAINRVITDTVPKAQGVNIVTQFRYYPWNVRSGSMLQKVIDGESHTCEFEYDPSGLKTKMTYQDNSTQSWVYDDAHNLQSRKTVAGEIQNFGYDERNRKIAEWWDDFPADGEWRAFDYDDDGHLVLAANGIGDWWSNFIADVRRSYDDAGRLVTDQQTVYVSGIPNTKIVSYPSYYDDGKLHRMNVNGIAGYDYSFGYDEMRRLEFIFPSGDPNPLFKYSYDDASNEIQRYNSSNRIAQDYARDELNRIKSVEVKRTNTNTQLGLEVYDYYAIGRLHTVTREDNTQDQFVYYLDGELKQATYGVSATPPPSQTPTPRPTATPTPVPGQVAEPSFNPSGRNIYPNTTVTVTISTTTTGAQIRYSFDGGNTWTTIANNGTATFSVGLAGKTLIAIGFKSGMADSDPHNDYYWREDPGGGRGPMAPETDGIIPYPLDTGDGFGQGLMAPMVTTVTYTLDKAGNRLSVNGTSYSPNSINQYTVAASQPMTNGNDHEIHTYRGFAYTYMRDQELQRVTAPGLVYELAYDALGRCVRRTANGDLRYPIYYIYDGDKPILEFRANGAIARNVYGKGVDEILQRYDPAVNGGQWFYYQQDHEGSITHLTNWNNGSGQIIERYRYDAFGTPTIYAPNWSQRNTSTYNNRFLFTGREYAGAWVYEYRARVYNSEIGRFMSEDPKLFDAGDYNLFRYCHNDPIDMTDPMGTETNMAGFSPLDNHNASVADSTWAMAKWADSSNNFGGTFAQFTAGQGLTMGQVTQNTGQGVMLRAKYRQMNQEKLAGLDARFAPMARRFVDASNAQFNPEGLEVRISHGTRSLDEQGELYRKYLTDRKYKAAPPGRSAHNYGMAIDIAIIRGSAVVDRPATWERLGRLGESLGLRWGHGFDDDDHFQHPGISTSGAHLLRLHQQGRDILTEEPTN